MIEVEYLTDELCLLPGGIADEKLAALPMLRRLAGVPDDARMTHATSLIRSWLKRAIPTIEEAEFEGRLLSRDVLVRAFNIELEFEKVRVSAPERRHEVMKLVGLICSTQTWRKTYERKFLNILAEHLYQITEGLPLERV